MSKHVTRATIQDAVGVIYTQEQADAIVAAYPAHEREARAKGIPQLGSGRIFPVADEVIATPSIQIPDHWPQLGALDFGWDHPTAAIKLAWNRDDDIVYITAAYKRREAPVPIHAAAVKPWGDIYWAWPHDGENSTAAGAGVNLSTQYKDQGLKMLPERAQFEDGSHSVEAGIQMMLTRMETGKLKVFEHLSEWFDEFRLYHRKDGRIVKEFDDLMSATRYGIMMLRYARTKPKPPQRTGGASGGWMG